MGPLARILPDGRLHLQHGPSDLIIMAEGEYDRAFEAASARFETIIAEVAAELPTLRRNVALSSRPLGGVPRRMSAAALPFADGFVTSMAAVAGAIADEVLDAMVQVAGLRRAYVNNGGDIALHLAPGESFRTAMKAHDGGEFGRIEIHASDPVRGIATSGRHGRSLSLGIADSVTVLAKSAARADVAATLIANAVDLPGHPGITRRPGRDVVDDSDLGHRLVTVGCAELSRNDRQTALQNGLARAVHYEGLIEGAALFLQGSNATFGTKNFQLEQEGLYA